MNFNTVILRLRFFFYAVIVLVLGCATLLANKYGNAWVEEYMYGHAWFVVLLAVFFILVSYSALQAKVWRRFSSLVGYFSFLTILLGSFLSFSTSEKGYSHLIKGVACGTFDDKEYKTHILPFDLVLDSFCVVRYPGTDAPMDYVSYLRLDGVPKTISMNCNLCHEGYRFCQSGSDSMSEDSWLSVNYDPYGTGLVFFGYALFVLYGILSLSTRDGRFRTLLRDPLLKRGGMFMVLFLCASFPKDVCAAVPDSPVRNVTERQAADWGRKQVVYQSRIVPLNTVAADFVKKITGASSYQGLLPEQVLCGWNDSPQFWRRERMILVQSSELRSLLHFPGRYCCYADLVDKEGRNRLDSLTCVLRNNEFPYSLRRSIEELDEKIGIIMMLEHHTLYAPFPSDGSVSPLSETKVSAEILYNKLLMTKVLFMGNLSLGVLSFVLFLIGGSSRKRYLWLETIVRFLPYLLLLSTIAHAFQYGLRWYIAGRLPLSNGYETMQFLALCVMCFSLLFCRWWRNVVTFGFLMSGFALLVSYLGQMNPQITPLMPVLNSPWLSFHVSFVMMSYALFAFLFLNSLTALALIWKVGMNEQVTSLTLTNRLLLYPAMLLLGIGIALGSVWANESWGCFWGWDPKEVWALISFLVYGAAIVFRDLYFFSKEKSFHCYLVIAFLSILMTYFGVNYFLGGLHSYANA